MTGYYSFVYPKEGESSIQRDARPRAGYEYTEDFELVLQKTGEGWRFDAFSNTAVDAGAYPDHSARSAQPGRQIPSASVSTAPSEVRVLSTPS